jgi:hypothetical protein
MTVLRRNTVLYALSWAEVRGENTELDLFVGRYKVSRATSSYVDVIINILENKTLFELAVFSYCVQIVGAGAAATGLSVVDSLVTADSQITRAVRCTTICCGFVN